ncbi:hypothetical protein MJT46_018563 [Ovis ammon polii x Ovis aries]|nr:hypothetical protein MJT46_018563 [Ovis ammon polii x Ovis aries]
MGEESREAPEELAWGLAFPGATIAGPCGPRRKEFPGFPSHLKRRRSPQERQEEFQGRATIPSPPDVSVHSNGSCFPYTALTFKPRIDSHHVCRLQKYRRIHVSTGEESSGSASDSTQGLRPRHRRERNPERPPSNSHGDWPFLRPPERVPEVPVVSRQHLPQLEKIQEVLPSRERIPGVPVASQEEALSTGQARGTPASWHHSKSPPDVSVHSRGTCFACTALTSKPTIDSHHVCTWDSPLGKPRGKDSRENHRSFDPRGGLRDTAATALEESASVCPDTRRGLTPLGRLQKYSKIHVSTGEESTGSGPDSTQGLRPRHRRERNPERPPRNSHRDWPFLRPPERVPEVPVVSREHLPKLEKIQEVLPSRRDEDHFR